MARVQIEDLNEENEIGTEEMKAVFGGVDRMGPLRKMPTTGRNNPGADRGQALMPDRHGPIRTPSGAPAGGMFDFGNPHD